MTIAPSITPDTANALPNKKVTGRAQQYLTNTRQNAAAALDASNRGDFEAAGFLGHGLRGSGGMFGFQGITDIGAALEMAAEHRDQTALRMWAEALLRYLDDLELSAPQAAS